jgi:hypothetical protein
MSAAKVVEGAVQYHPVWLVMTASSTTPQQTFVSLAF